MADKSCMRAAPLKKWKSHLLRDAFIKTTRFLPRSLRAHFIAANFEISYNSPSGLTLKRAETPDEIKQALQLMTDGSKFEPTLSSLQTVFFIAKWHNEVIGSLSLVTDGRCGLPIETVFPVAQFRDEKLSVAEISRLSLKKDVCLHPANILLPLSKLVYDHCTQVLKLDFLITSTTPDSELFYSDVLLFKILLNTNLTTVAGLRLDDRLVERFKQVYNHKEKKKNLYHYFIEHQPSCIQPTTGLRPAAWRDRRKNKEIAAKKRIDLELKAVAFLSGSTKASDCRLINVSETGLQIKLLKPEDQILLGQNIFVVFEKNHQWVMCHAVIRWFESQDRVGCIVVEKTPSWEKFIAELLSDADGHLRKAA